MDRCCHFLEWAELLTWLGFEIYREIARIPQGGRAVKSGCPGDLKCEKSKAILIQLHYSADSGFFQFNRLTRRGKFNLSCCFLTIF